MCDETLAARIRRVLAKKKNIVEKKMFGGTGFLLSGNLLVGIWKNKLIARIGPEAYDQALREPFVQEFDITGKSMRGWVMIQASGIEDEDQLKDWIQLAIRFVSTLNPK